MLWAVALDVCDVAPLAGALDEYDEMFCDVVRCFGLWPSM
jgi:hypothetical protein